MTQAISKPTSLIAFFNSQLLGDSVIVICYSSLITQLKLLWMRLSNFFYFLFLLPLFSVILLLFCDIVDRCIRHSANYCSQNLTVLQICSAAAMYVKREEIICISYYPTINMNIHRPFVAVEHKIFYSLNRLRRCRTMSEQLTVPNKPFCTNHKPYNTHHCT